MLRLKALSLENAREAYECLQEMAPENGFYNACQVLPSEGRPVAEDLSRARLAACDAVRITLALCLKLIGVSAPEVMRREEQVEE